MVMQFTFFQIPTRDPGACFDPSDSILECWVRHFGVPICPRLVAIRADQLGSDPDLVSRQFSRRVVQPK